jgi:hypothetical protein
MAANRPLAPATAFVAFAMAVMLLTGQAFAGCLHLVGDGPRLSADRSSAEFTVSNGCGHVIWAIGCGVDLENGRPHCDWQPIGPNCQIGWPLFPDQWRHFELASCGGATGDPLWACLERDSRVSLIQADPISLYFKYLAII